MRRWCFQIHLWTGLGVGLYVIVMSLTGSAVVFRSELGRLLTPVPSVVPSGARRSREQLIEDAERALPNWIVTNLQLSADPTKPVEILMRRGRRRVDKIFNPYTGDIMGERVPREPRAMEWLADLHDNLLGGARGRWVNGAGAVAFTILCLTGAVVWWPRGSWRRSLLFVRGTWRQVAWSAHSVIGVWMLGLLLVWAVSGVYLAFPAAFDSVGDLMDRLDQSGHASRTMIQLLAWMSDAHFGRFAGAGVKALWVVLGLTPVALLVTGIFMWWTRFGRGNLDKS